MNPPDIPDTRLGFPLEVKLAGVEGALAGYASTFGGLPDAYGDVIAAGAFAKSIAEHRRAGTAPVMLWSHNPAEPIGRWSEVKEDGHGLHVRGELNLDVQRAREARSLIKQGAIGGLSIGFRVAPGGRDRDASGFALLKEIQLFEVSVVAIPANTAARLSGAKDVSSVRDFEGFLRKAGFAKAAAAKIARDGWGGLSSDPDASDAAALAAEIRAATEGMKQWT